MICATGQPHGSSRAESLTQIDFFCWVIAPPFEIKAGVTIATETHPLSFAIACLTEPGRQDFAMRLFERNFRYALLLTGYFFVYVGWLLYLIIPTIEIFLPCEVTGSKINLREYKPKKLFYLNDFDVCGNLISTFEEHKTVFSQMSKTEIKQEYIYEPRKRQSYSAGWF